MEAGKMNAILDMHPQALYEMVYNMMAFYIAAIFSCIGIVAGIIIGYIRAKKRLPGWMQKKIKEQKKIIKNNETDLLNLAEDAADMRAKLDRHMRISDEWKEGNKEDAGT
jgi:uncharacterized membrane-anchored protein YhcB (DUF1043 family)